MRLLRKPLRINSIKKESWNPNNPGNPGSDISDIVNVFYSYFLKPPFFYASLLLSGWQIWLSAGGKRGRRGLREARRSII
jgi:hypothetical protein